MADEKTPNADFVGRVVSDANNPPETRLLTGWFGDAADDGYRRLYTDPELSSHVDIPADAILYTEPIKDSQPVGAVLVWVRADAAIRQGGTAFTRAARFLQGQVQQDYLAAGAANGPIGGGGGDPDYKAAGYDCPTSEPKCEPTGFTGQCTEYPNVGGGAWPCITAAPQCVEVTGLTGKCTDVPWPNPTAYYGCTYYHCPTNDLTCIPQICNVIAVPPEPPKPAEGEGEGEAAAAAKTLMPGCGYTKTWGLCETKLLGCGYTKTWGECQQPSVAPCPTITVDPQTCGAGGGGGGQQFPTTLCTPVGNSCDAGAAGAVGPVGQIGQIGQVGQIQQLVTFPIWRCPSRIVICRSPFVFCPPSPIQRCPSPIICTIVASPAPACGGNPSPVCGPIGGDPWGGLGGGGGFNQFGGDLGGGGVAAAGAVGPVDQANIQIQPSLFINCPTRVIWQCRTRFDFICPSVIVWRCRSPLPRFCPPSPIICQASPAPLCGGNPSPVACGTVGDPWGGLGGGGGFAGGGGGEFEAAAAGAPGVGPTGVQGCTQPPNCLGPTGWQGCTFTPDCGYGGGGGGGAEAAGAAAGPAAFGQIGNVQQIATLFINCRTRFVWQCPSRFVICTRPIWVCPPRSPLCPPSPIICTIVASPAPACGGNPSPVCGPVGGDPWGGLGGGGPIGGGGGFEAGAAAGAQVGPTGVQGCTQPPNCLGPTGWQGCTFTPDCGGGGGYGGGGGEFEAGAAAAAPGTIGPTGWQGCTQPPHCFGPTGVQGCTQPPNCLGPTGWQGCGGGGGYGGGGGWGGGDPSAVDACPTRFGCETNFPPCPPGGGGGGGGGWGGPSAVDACPTQRGCQTPLCAQGGGGGGGAQAAAAGPVGLQNIAIAPTPATRCFICPPITTQPWRCWITQPWRCNWPTPATRCFICPPWDFAAAGGGGGGGDVQAAAAAGPGGGGGGAQGAQIGTWPTPATRCFICPPISQWGCY